MTTWPARRDGNRILCGRLVAGRHVCQGEVARVQLPGGDAETWKPDGSGKGGEYIFLMPGYKEVPRGSGNWIPNRRGANMAARGQTPTWRTSLQVGQRDASRITKPPSTAALFPMQLPFTIPCPHCKCVAEVTSRLLS